MFVKEITKTGTQRVKEYSLCDPRGPYWFYRDSQNRLYLQSPHPISMREYYGNAEAGSLDFAYKMLDLMKKYAGTGEFLPDHTTVETQETDLEFVNAFEFEVSRDVGIPTGLEFDHDLPDLTTDLGFEVRGPRQLVDDFVRNYGNDYPSHLFGTEIEVLDRSGDNKTVRITRADRKMVAA